MGCFNFLLFCHHEFHVFNDSFKFDLHLIKYEHVFFSKILRSWPKSRPYSLAPQFYPVCQLGQNNLHMTIWSRIFVNFTIYSRSWLLASAAAERSSLIYFLWITSICAIVDQSWYFRICAWLHSCNFIFFSDS